MTTWLYYLSAKSIPKSMRHRASRTPAEITGLIDLRCQRAQFRATRATGNGKGNPRKRDPERERVAKSAYEFSSSIWLKSVLCIHMEKFKKIRKSKS